MNLDVDRELQILTEISLGSHVTQRGLAKKLGVALGLTNLLIRRLAKKGAIKIVNIQRNRVKYFITPGGIAEKARLTYEYLEYSLHFYRQIRAYLIEALGGVDRSTVGRVALYGVGEVAEIAALVIQQHGLNIATVVDGPAAGQSFLTLPVQRPEACDARTFGLIVVASLTERAAVREELIALGADPARIITFPDVPDLFRWRPAP